MKQVKIINGETYIEIKTDIVGMTCTWCDIPEIRKTRHGTTKYCKYHGNCSLPEGSYFRKVKPDFLRSAGGM